MASSYRLPYLVLVHLPISLQATNYRSNSITPELHYSQPRNPKPQTPPCATKTLTCLFISQLQCRPRVPGPSKHKTALQLSAPLVPCTLYPVRQANQLHLAWYWGHGPFPSQRHYFPYTDFSFRHHHLHGLESRCRSAIRASIPLKAGLRPAAYTRR
ncbi:hypothetical protein GGI35DRAFT_59377 [Trichoderma velutinum]